MTLLKGTRIIRRDMLDTKSKFNGTYISCEQESRSVPGSLKTIIGRFFFWGGGGGRFEDRVKGYDRSADNSISISQLILFNATKRRRDSGTKGASNCHSREREPPLFAHLSRPHGSLRNVEVYTC